MTGANHRLNVLFVNNRLRELHTLKGHVESLSVGENAGEITVESLWYTFFLRRQIVKIPSERKTEILKV